MVIEGEHMLKAVAPRAECVLGLVQQAALLKVL
jgi:hypothetical protein